MGLGSRIPEQTGVGSPLSLLSRIRYDPIIRFQSQTGHMSSSQSSSPQPSPASSPASSVFPPLASSLPPPLGAVGSELLTGFPAPPVEPGPDPLDSPELARPKPGAGAGAGAGTRGPLPPPLPPPLPTCTLAPAPASSPKPPSASSSFQPHSSSSWSAYPLVTPPLAPLWLRGVDKSGPGPALDGPADEP